MTKKKRKPRKRTGTSLGLLLTLLVAAFPPLAAAPKKKPVLDTYAVVSVSVFDDSGYALTGAEVILAPDVQPTKANTIEMVSGARGEAVVRVPPGPMHYNATVHAKGFQSQRKTVSVEDQERVEVTFQLERESK